MKTPRGVVSDETPRGGRTGTRKARGGGRIGNNKARGRGRKARARRTIVILKISQRKDLHNVHCKREEEETVNDEGGEEEVGTDDDNVDGDDCEVVLEDIVGEPHANMIDVEIYKNLEEHYGDVATQAPSTDEVEKDSGDDVWDDMKIPDPFSDDDAEFEGRPTHGARETVQ